MYDRVTLRAALQRLTFESCRQILHFVQDDRARLGRLAGAVTS